MKKQPTFMQLFRQWNASGATLRADLDPPLISKIGYPLARRIHLFSERVARAGTRCTVHTRINYRAAAAQQDPTWPARNGELTKMWRSWQV